MLTRLTPSQQCTRQTKTGSSHEHPLAKITPKEKRTTWLLLLPPPSAAALCDNRHHHPHHPHLRGHNVVQDVVPPRLMRVDYYCSKIQRRTTIIANIMTNINKKMKELQQQRYQQGEKKKVKNGEYLLLFC